MIPLNIFSTWHTKNLPPKMSEAMENIKKLNPEFTYHLYDFDDCRNFLISNFEKDIIDAFDKLKPAAYKSDLWRYCILYKYGGIYLDIKFTPLNNFKFIDLINAEHFCRDMHKETTALTGFIVCKPLNPIMLRCIQNIVENVKQNFYGNGSLDPTGPILLTKCLDKQTFHNLGPLRLENDIYICYHNMQILKRYSEYRDEQNIFQITEHYDSMWRNKNIYNI